MKLPTIWRVEKQSREVESEDEKQRREVSRVRRKKIQLRGSQKKEDAHARNVRKIAKCCVFPMICGSARSKSRLAKAAGAEPCRQRRQEKLHAAVARSTFSSKNAKMTVSEHFWNFRCRKFARRCGPKK